MDVGWNGTQLIVETVSFSPSWGIGVIMPHCSMATYTISQHPGGTSYDISVIGDDGVRQMMLGFQTEADAQDWIARDQGLTNQAGTADTPIERTHRTGNAGW
jgi:hypothetical protein